MQIDVRFIRLQSSPSLTQHVQRRILFALDRFQQHISHVSVRLQDVNGPRGGVDKSCTVEVALLRGGTVRLDELGEDVYAVADRASTRIRHSVAREIGRQQRNATHGPGLSVLPTVPDEAAMRASGDHRLG